MRKLLVVALLTASAALGVDFSPHDLTSNYSHQPYIVVASTAYFPAYYAFDGTTNYWLGTNAGTDWLQIDIGTGQSALLSSYSVQVDSVPEPARAPKNWTIQGSPDGVTFTVLDTQTNQTAWGSGETRTFTVSGVTTYYRFFRLNITANNGDATYTQTQELHFLGTTQSTADFAPHNMTASNAPSPFVASASSAYTPDSDYAQKAFDGVVAAGGTGHNWLGTGSGTDWLEIDIGAGTSNKLGSYDIVSQDETSRAPKGWTMQGSNDGTTWSTLDTQTNQTAWAVFESRLFTVTGSAAYRYYRLNITANNGDATYTEVAELYLYSPPVSGGGGTGTSANQPVFFLVM